MTMSQACALYRARIVERGRSPVTVGNHVRVLDHFGRFLRNRSATDLRAVTRHDIDAYAAALAARYTPPTCMAMLGVVKGFWDVLVDAGRLLFSPAEHVRHRRIIRQLGPVLSESDIRKLIEAENTGLPLGIRNRALFELLYATGLRRKEVCGLTVRDVDLAGLAIRVRYGKGDKERITPMTEQARQWLGEYLGEVRPRFARKAQAGEDRVFLSAFGRALDPATLTQVLQRLGRRVGVPHVSCHAFRRTMATALLRGGADVRVVSEILGHASLDPTERYTKLVLGDLREVQARTHPRARTSGHGGA
jgi:integrase/recombinase XerD